MFLLAVDLAARKHARTLRTNLIISNSPLRRVAWRSKMSRWMSCKDGFRFCAIRPRRGWEKMYEKAILEMEEIFDDFEKILQRYF